MVVTTNGRSCFSSTMPTVCESSLVVSKSTAELSGTYTWRPLDPDVLARQMSSSWVSRSRTVHATSAHWATPAGAPGSRSKTMVVGRSGSSASASEGWSSSAARFASHTSVSSSSTEHAL